MKYRHRILPVIAIAAAAIFLATYNAAQRYMTLPSSEAKTPSVENAPVHPEVVEPNIVPDHMETYVVKPVRMKVITQAEADSLTMRQEDIDSTKKLLTESTVPSTEVKKPTYVVKPVRMLVIHEDETDPEMREKVMAEVRQLRARKTVPPKTPTVEECIRDLNSDNARIRRDAADKLGELGHAAAKAVPNLALLVSDEDAEVRMAAAYAMASVSPSGEQVVPLLITLLGDQDPDVRIVAALSCGKLKGEASQAVPALAKLLTDENAEVACFSAEALGQIGEAAAAVEDDLLKALNDPRSDVRISAALAFGGIGRRTPEIIDALEDRLQNDSSGFVKRGAGISLVTLGHVDETIQYLIANLEFEQWRRDLKHALRDIGKPAVPALIDALQNAEKTVIRRNAAIILGRMNANSPDVLAALKQAAKEDPDPNVRLKANWSLERIARKTAE